jgi:hypothetical protein
MDFPLHSFNDVICSNDSCKSWILQGGSTVTISTGKEFSFEVVFLMTVASCAITKVDQE